MLSGLTLQTWFNIFTMQYEHNPQKHFVFKNQFEIDVKTSSICPQDRALWLAKQMHMNTAFWLAYTKPSMCWTWIMFTLYTETETLPSILNIGSVRDIYKCFRNLSINNHHSSSMISLKIVDYTSSQSPSTTPLSCSNHNGSSTQQSSRTFYCRAEPKQPFNNLHKRYSSTTTREPYEAVQESTKKNLLSSSHLPIIRSV